MPRNPRRRNESMSEKKTETVKKAAAAKKPAAKKAAAPKAAPKTATKTAAKAAVKSAVKAAASKTAAKKPAPKAKAVEYIIQSPMGGEITPAEILKKVGKADKIYIRVDQNKAYWISGKESGSVDLW